MEITAYWEGGYRSRVPVRDFEIVVDEPSQYGGTDKGPMPTELFLSALASCFEMAVYHAFRKRQVELPDLAVRAEADYDGLRFARIRLEVLSSHPQEEIEKILEQAISYCYVSNTLLKQPTMEFTVGDFSIIRRPAAPPA
ncbi:MAG: OsmC family protein [Actinomycetota bacterium]